MMAAAVMSAMMQRGVMEIYTVVVVEVAALMRQGRRGGVSEVKANEGRSGR